MADLTRAKMLGCSLNRRRMAHPFRLIESKLCSSRLRLALLSAAAAPGPWRCQEPCGQLQEAAVPLNLVLERAPRGAIERPRQVNLHQRLLGLDDRPPEPDHLP